MHIRNRLFLIMNYVIELPALSGALSNEGSPELLYSGDNNGARTKLSRVDP